MSAFLLTSAGRRVGLLQCFRSSAAKLGLSLRAMAADANPELSAACRVADHYFALPRADHPDYASAVLDACVRSGVRLVVPTIDTELLPLAHKADAFASAGIRLNLGSLGAVQVARDKSETARALQGLGLTTPVEYDWSDVAARTAPLPLIGKPRGGSSSKGIVRITEWSDAHASLDRSLMFQELVSGPEYTVNVFASQGGQFVAAVPHLRLETRSGEVSKGRITRHPALTQAAKAIVAGVPGLTGAFCFQAIDTQKGPKIFEINARFGGGYPIAHAAGAEFSTWLLEETFGLPSSGKDEWRDQLLALRYDQEVIL